MRIISKKVIREFWEKYPDSEQALKTWYREASRASWNNPSQVKRDFGRASFLGKNRVVFKIGGNKYRLIVEMEYKRKWIFIRFIGTHSHYDKIDALNV